MKGLESRPRRETCGGREKIPQKKVPANLASNAGAYSLLLCVALFFVVTVGELSAETLSWESNRSSFTRARGSERTLLSGDVRIVSDGMTIEADEVEIYGEDYRFLLGRGNIRVRDEERGILLTSDRFFYDRVKKISRAEGNPVMEDLKNEVVVRGGLIENREEEDLAIVQVGVLIVSIEEGEEMVSRSEFARYHREEEVLELSGLPEVIWKGDEYSATRIRIELDPVEIELEGRVRGRVETEEEQAEVEEDSSE
jgi:lipopolysaccharide export system protein LptA